MAYILKPNDESQLTSYLLKEKSDASVKNISIQEYIELTESISQGGSKDLNNSLIQNSDSAEFVLARSILGPTTPPSSLTFRETKNDYIYGYWEPVGKKINNCRNECAFQVGETTTSSIQFSLGLSIGEKRAIAASFGYELSVTHSYGLELGLRDGESGQLHVKKPYFIKEGYLPTGGILGGEEEFCVIQIPDKNPDPEHELIYDVSPAKWAIEVFEGVTGEYQYLSCKEDGSVVDLWNDLGSRQTWHLEPLKFEDGKHRICISGGVYTARRYLSCDENGKVKLDLWNGGDMRQKWYLKELANGKWLIEVSGGIDKRNYKYLSQDGHRKVDLWKDPPGRNQFWHLKRVG